LGVHSSLEVVPSASSDGFVRFGDSARALLEDVEKHEELVGAAVEHPEEPAAVVAPELTQFALDLAAMREALCVRLT
jgi:hypothetical protein